MELFNKNKKDTITILKINAPITSLIAIAFSVDMQKSKNKFKMFIKVHKSLIQY